MSLLTLRLAPYPGAVALLAAFMALGSTPTALNAQGVELFAETFSVSSSPTVDVNVADADLIFMTHAGAAVEVRVIGHSDDAADARDLFTAMDFEASASGGSVRVRASDPQMGRNWWRSGRRAGVTILISAPTNADLEVRTSDGDIEIGDFSGRVSLRSSDGDIVAGRLSGDRIDVHTSDGDIRIDHVTGAATQVRTSDGDIDISVSGGSIEATSSDGDVWMDLDGSTEVRIRTGDGDVTVRAPDTIAADVYLQGEDLEVDGRFDLQGQIHEGRVSGSINGGGPVLEARTGDGSISLVLNRTREASQVR